MRGLVFEMVNFRLTVTLKQTGSIQRKYSLSNLGKMYGKQEGWMLDECLNRTAYFFDVSTPS
jgi:hypothetical protein